MEAAERTLLEETVLDALERAAPSPTGAADAALTDLGWLEMLGAEPRAAVAIVFHALGATNANATALDDVVISALGIEPGPDRAFLFPSFATWSPPARAGDDVVHAHGLATARIAAAKELVVVTGSDDGELGTVTIPCEAVHSTPVTGVDPDVGWHAVRFEGATPLATRTAPGQWAAAVAAGRRAVSHQIEGTCRTMLTLAREHALEREQFGRPVAQFQAVRHRLADALVALESLDAALGAAWDEPNATTAALAKAIAGRTARTVAAQCQQVLAGIGFTTDHAFHRSLKRALVLEGIFGTSDEIVTELGRGLLAARSVPTLIEL